MLVAINDNFVVNNADRDQPVYMILRLNTPVRVQDRQRFYEDGLEILMQEDDLGEVIGGTALPALRGSKGMCEIEMALIDDSDQTIRQLCTCLEDVYVPSGSTLIIEGETEAKDRHIPVGRAVGLCVQLTTTVLLEALEQKISLDDLLVRMDAALGGMGSYRGEQKTPEATRLYFYGRDISEMENALIKVIEAHPVLSFAQIERV